VTAAQKPPAGLLKAGIGLWKAVVRDVDEAWELDARDLHVLELAARAADRAAELGDLIDRDGLMIAGSTGQDRLHPAVVEQRMQRQLSAVLVAKVQLEPPAVRTGHLSGRQRADIRRSDLRAIQGGR
jgi:hypothetical protein